MGTKKISLWRFPRPNAKHILLGIASRSITLAPFIWRYNVTKVTPLPPFFFLISLTFWFLVRSRRPDFLFCYSIKQKYWTRQIWTRLLGFPRFCYHLCHGAPKRFQNEPETAETKRRNILRILAVDNWRRLIWAVMCQCAVIRQNLFCL